MKQILLSFALLICPLFWNRNVPESGVIHVFFFPGSTTVSGSTYDLACILGSYYQLQKENWQDDIWYATMYEVRTRDMKRNGFLHFDSSYRTNRMELGTILSRPEFSNRVKVYYK